MKMILLDLDLAVYIGQQPPSFVLNYRWGLYSRLIDVQIMKLRDKNLMLFSTGSYIFSYLKILESGSSSVLLDSLQIIYYYTISSLV